MDKRELVQRGSRLRSAMQDAETYRQYADECSKLALSMPKHRKELEDMAAAWNALAEAAETQRAKAKADGKSDGSN